METSVISEIIRVTRLKNQIMLIIPLVIALLFTGNLTGAALPAKKSTVAVEEIFKFKTELAREALFKTVFSVHYLKKGETIYRLSRNYYVTETAIMSLNRISDPRSIPAGRMLFIPPVDYRSGRLKKYSVKPGDTIEDLLSRSGLELWQFNRINQGLTAAPLKTGSVIYLPPLNEKMRITTSAPLISIIKPVSGRITSRFGMRWGRMHNGIDLAAPLGAPVRAAASGRVVFAGWNGGYGKFVRLMHGKYATNYGHLSQIIVKQGSYVQKGDLIGLVGATGYAFGSHLHFELELDGKKVDPLTYLR
ncbi:MAG: peptidoglycan DD-metalloendopeptidase family protein [Firmicutes bacterium]|nr:peptidoglycan DD-metalloendopeptidase family protein [Bacillota bacterium]